MINSRLFILFFLIINSLFANNYIDSLNLTKIKKLVQKEEELAVVYKKYLLEKGGIPSSIEILKNNDYLLKGFDDKNPFGKKIILLLDDNSTTTSGDDKHKIENFLPSELKLKSNIYDYYYSSTNRIHTKAPLSIKNNSVEIVLSSKEKFIYKNTSNITTEKPDDSTKTPKSKYYLDEDSVLHWYDDLGEYKFSFDRDLLVDVSVDMLDSDGNKTDEFNTLMEDKDILYSGQIIFHKNKDEEGSTGEYVNIGENEGIIKLNSKTRDIGKTIIQFTRRAGGMIVNGDIYTWGNNANKITGIDLGYSGQMAYNRYPVVNGLVQLRAVSYNENLDNKNYFSSPLRPKFIDFFSTVYTGTCGVSTKGELYCGGTTGVNYDFGTSFTHVDNSNKGEMLYRSTFFNGVDNKAKKVFSNNQLWLILAEDGYLYRWGYDHSGFSGNGSTNFNNDRWRGIDKNKSPETISSIKFSDITYLLTIGYRKIGALSTTGDIYIWGVEDEISKNKGCTVKWESINFNLCSPTKVTKDSSILNADLKFESIQGSLESFVAKDINGKYYKIHQPVNKKIQVISVNESIKKYSEYEKDDDNEILSVDFSSKLNGSSLVLNDGIVWINSKNELKGDYFTSSNKNDEIFKKAIKRIKWRKIKVISDDNGMCGIDVNSQMYCWGIQSFYRKGSSQLDYMGNTFMIPVFNTNLYDLEKDFLVAEGGSSGYLTNITSGDWSTTNNDGKSGTFFIKYPTYIGGFNYDFIFK